MATPLIFENNQAPQGTSVSTPLIFGGTPAKQPAIFAPPPAPAPQPQQNFLQKIQSTLGNVVNKAKQGFQEGGIGGAISNAFTPDKNKQPKEVFEQNLRTYVENPKDTKSAEVLHKVGKALIDNFVIPTVKTAENTGALVGGTVDKAFGVIDKQNEKLLRDRGFIDEKGKLNLGKSTVEIAKNTVNIATLIPGIFTPLTTAFVGGNVIRVAGLTVPVSKVAEGMLVGGSFATLYTPNLEKILTDPEVVGEAAKNFATGAALGGLIEFPASLIKLPKSSAINKLSEVEKAELGSLKISLAKKYHPNSMLPEASNEAWQTIQKKIGEADIVWLRKLQQSSPKEAENLLKIKFEPIDEGKQIAEKAGQNQKSFVPEPTKPPITQETRVPKTSPNEQKAIQNVQKYIQTPEAKLQEETIEYLSQKRVGVDELSFKDGKITVYREGNVTPGKPVSFSLNQTKGQTPYTLAKDEIILNTNSKDLVDLYNKSFDAETAPGMVEALQKFNGLESEVIAIPKVPENASTGIVEAPGVSYRPPKPRVLKPIGTGETKVSSLGVGVEQKAIEKKLAESFSDLPEYKQLSMKDQANQALNLLEKDREKAIRIALGQENPPKGLVPEAVYIAVENKALEEGSVNLLRELATSSRVGEATAMGQRIRVLAERNPDSPVSIMKSVVDARKKQIEENLKKTPKQAIKDTVGKIKAKIAKPSKHDWSKFIDEIEC